MVQPLAYNLPGNKAAPTPYAGYLQAHQQQQLAGAKVGGQPPRPPGPTTSGRGPPPPPNPYGATKRPYQGAQGGSLNPRRPPVPVYGLGGDLRCYMAQDGSDGPSDTTQHEPLAEDGGAAAMAAAEMIESTATAYSAQEWETHASPTQAPY